MTELYSFDKFKGWRIAIQQDSTWVEGSGDYRYEAEVSKGLVLHYIGGHDPGALLTAAKAWVRQQENEAKDQL